MKILLLTDSFIKGGKERQMMELMKGLKTHPDIKFELVLFSKRIEYKEVYNLEIPIHTLERKPKKDPRIFLRFYQLCRQSRPDVIHSWGSMPSIYALPAAKILGISFINEMIRDAPHNMSLWDTRMLRAKLTFPFSEIVVGNSQAGLHAYGASVNKGVFIHNGFDLNRIKNLDDKDSVKAKFHIQTPYIVGMVGAFADRKDYPTYIRAAINVLTQRKDVTFLAIGDGKRKAECEALVPDELRKYIIFTGLQDRVESLINVFHIGVLTTYKAIHGEGISNAIMEYMALGKPVIATNTGGTSEIVRQDENGYLTEDQDVDQLAEYILKLLDNPSLCEGMGRSGKERLYNEFTMDKMVRQHIELYQKVLNQPVRQTTPQP